MWPSPGGMLDTCRSEVKSCPVCVVAHLQRFRVRVWPFVKLPLVCRGSSWILKTQAAEWFVSPRTWWHESRPTYFYLMSSIFWSCTCDYSKRCGTAPDITAHNTQTHTCTHPLLYWGAHFQSLSGFASVSEPGTIDLGSVHYAQCSAVSISQLTGLSMESSPTRGSWRSSGGGWPQKSFLESPLMDGEVNNSSSSPQGCSGWWT